MAPRAFLVDAKGIIRYKRIGAITPEIIAFRVEASPGRDAKGNVNEPRPMFANLFVSRVGDRPAGAALLARAVDVLPFKDHAEGSVSEPDQTIALPGLPERALGRLERGSGQDLRRKSSSRCARARAMRRSSTT